MKHLTYLILIIIATLTIGLRWYRIDAPVADWHSFRQTDTASVARIFVSDGIDLLHPRYHDLSNIQSGKDNPKGYRMVEFPLYQGVAALITRTFPGISVERSLRYVSIAAATGTAVLLTVMAAMTVSPLVGMLTGLVYAVLPYSVFFGRTILPETFAVFWAMLSMYLISVGARQSSHRYRRSVFVVLSACAGALTLLVKPTAGFLLLPVPYLILRSSGISVATLVHGALYGAIAIVPFWWWRGWIAQFPEGIPVFDWLLNKGNIRFKGAWFQWLFAERLGKLILGFWGLVPFGLGLIVPNGKKDSSVWHVLGLGGLLYLSVFAAGNVQHDYYQVILLPIVSVYVAKGLAWIVTQRQFPALGRIALSGVAVLFMLAFSWYTIRTYYWINRPEIIEAGAAADRLLPKNAKVIAPYNGDTTFLYQTKRSGWPLGFDIDKKIAMGATHYVTVSPSDSDFETKELAEKYTVLVRNETYAIIDLTRPRNLAL